MAKSDSKILMRVTERLPVILTQDELLDRVGKPRRNNRHDVIQREEGVDVGNAVTYLEEAERGAVALTEAVKRFAIAAEKLLESGLTDAAVAILIQSLMKNQRNGRPFPQETILEVLHAAARLTEHLEEAK